MSIAGNPRIVATNGRYNVIERGDKQVRYALLREGDPIGTISTWKDRKLLSQVLVKGDYDRVDPPKKYVEVNK